VTLANSVRAKGTLLLAGIKVSVQAGGVVE
jgi:hypothetical protein